MQIRTKFLIVFFSLSVLPIAFFSYVTYSYARQTLLENIQERLGTIAELQISRIRELVAQSSSLSAVTTDYTGLGQTGEVIIGKRADDGVGIVFLAPRRFEEFAQNHSSLMEAALNNKEGFFTNAIDYQGKLTVAVTRYVLDLGLGVVVRIERDEAFRAVNALRDEILVFSIIFMIVIVMIALFFVHSITAPIRNLAFTAKQVRAGNLSKRAMVLTKDEIGELSTSFNSMVGALQEFTQDLEKKVAERTKELGAANKDLEAFTYSVSHDLRTPLRAVDGFSKALAEDYSEKLDDEGRRVINIIRASTQQMGNLIDDLLSFSRLGRQAIQTADVDMAALARSVFDELMLLNPDRAIRFTCAELPVARADASLMRQVWTNLLSNAIKFTRKNDDATITVGGVIEGESAVYFVKDNGVGFDMKYADKLFSVFQRLHTTEEFEGTGIGLSIVARIVTRHGGKVWTKGAVNEGAEFYFSLPHGGGVIQENNKKRKEKIENL